jgi:hypothetical protein
MGHGLLCAVAKPASRAAPLHRRALNKGLLFPRHRHLPWNRLSQFAQWLSSPGSAFPDRDYNYNKEAE